MEKNTYILLLFSTCVLLGFVIFIQHLAIRTMIDTAILDQDVLEIAYENKLKVDAICTNYSFKFIK